MSHEIKRALLLTILILLELIPADAQKENGWDNIEYRGQPWVKNISKPNKIEQGLQNRHITLWASHGRYFDLKKGIWKWQRPLLFGTTEDLFTQTIVVPYLIPMLENAGAVVFTPRERDWQKEEVIVDNDQKSATPYYIVNASRYDWTPTDEPGFAIPQGNLKDGDAPFQSGTALMIPTTKKKKHVTETIYRPLLKEAGRHAVYVSYQTTEESVPDAQYTVVHKGQKTVFHVNQQMGGGTWVYLGTFDFDAGCNDRNCVIVSNLCHHDGVVTTDAVRFGGGMGNIEREGFVSGLPRALEGSRYYAQWAGAPYSVYSTKDGADDYGDDINARSHMSNWLGGGSVYMPTLQGKKVPFELSLAVHSDAGFDPERTHLVGSLAICTTGFHDGLLNSGKPRTMSYDLAESLLSNVTNEMTAIYGNWSRRYLWDRNYSETRCPEVPSAILETLSHQNFPDMRYGQDPNFRFTLARCIYKTLLKYICKNHDEQAVVQPLPPVNIHAKLEKGGKVRLTWQGVSDPLEKTALPTSYNVYLAIGDDDFDNGINVQTNAVMVNLKPDIQYNFRVTAVNKGGESFPSETVSVVYHHEKAPTVLIVNGFQRLSGPAIRDNEEEQGFDLAEDPGVSYGLTAGWAGYQECFDVNMIGIEGEGGLGYCNNNLAGTFIAGNDFSFVKEHAEAIASAGRYNIVSCTKSCVENGMMKLEDYDCMDLILGLERDVPYQLKHYKTISEALSLQMRRFAAQGGRLLVSGSYVGTDMSNDEERQFLADILKISHGGNDRENVNNQVNGLGKQFQIYRQLNEKHYACTSPDILVPVPGAFCAMQYSDGCSAAVAYKGNDYHAFTIGFPLECIQDRRLRNTIMRGIMAFLMQ